LKLVHSEPDFWVFELPDGRQQGTFRYWSGSRLRATRSSTRVATSPWPWRQRLRTCRRL